MIGQKTCWEKKKGGENSAPSAGSCFVVRILKAIKVKTLSIGYLIRCLLPDLTFKGLRKKRTNPRSQTRSERKTSECEQRVFPNPDQKALPTETFVRIIQSFCKFPIAPPHPFFALSRTFYIKIDFGGLSKPFQITLESSDRILPVARLRQGSPSYPDPLIPGSFLQKRLANSIERSIRPFECWPSHVIIIFVSSS